MPSSSPTGTPKRSVRKMTSMEDLKGTHSEGLIMMPPAGMSRGSLKSESVPSTSTKQQGQPATTSVGRASSSPGKGGERSCMRKEGKFTRPLQDPKGRCIPFK